MLTERLIGQENVTYTHDGQVPCMCPQTGELHSVAYGGFEQDRETLKYRCPARYSGITCMVRCSVSDVVRIPLAEGRRVFTPVARSQLPVAGLPRPARRGGAGQQPVGWRLWVRATGHPRAGEDAAVHQHGADDHAGDGPGAHPGRPTREPAESGQTRLTGDRSPVTTRNHPIGSSARPVCPELRIERWMGPDFASRT